MGFGNVSERRSAPPQVGVSVVILALGRKAIPATVPPIPATPRTRPISVSGCPGQARPSAVPGLLGVARR